MSDYRIKDDSTKFSLQIIKLYKYLTEQKEFILSKQLLRSGTSIGANIMEAQFAASNRDFVHKMRIALKEANETQYWLHLLIESKLVPFNSERVTEIYEWSKKLTGTLVTIIKSSTLDT